MSHLIRLTMRVQLTKGRLGGMGAFAALGIIIAIATRSAGEDILDLVDAYGIGLYVPLCALILATAALGDLVEDGTLVYVWLRPIARWKIAVAALMSTLGVALPVAVAPVAVMAAIGGTTKDIAAAAAGTALAAIGYSSLFLALGLRVKRALVWGLAYIVIWEGAVSRVARSAGRLSVQLYSRSAMAHLADAELPPNGAGMALSVGICLATFAAAVAATTWWLKRLEVT